jgi:hypothetical protein
VLPTDDEQAELALVWLVASRAMQGKGLAGPRQRHATSSHGGAGGKRHSDNTHHPCPVHLGCESGEVERDRLSEAHARDLPVSVDLVGGAVQASQEPVELDESLLAPSAGEAELEPGELAGQPIAAGARTGTREDEGEPGEPGGETLDHERPPRRFTPAS